MEADKGKAERVRETSTGMGGDGRQDAEQFYIQQFTQPSLRGYLSTSFMKMKELALRLFEQLGQRGNNANHTWPYKVF